MPQPAHTPEPAGGLTAGGQVAVDRARWRLLLNLVRLLEPVMSVLGIVWLLLLVIEFTRGASPAVTRVTTAIWVIFLADFLLEFAVAPRKLLYLRRHWIALVSLALPALRFARLIRLVRVTRSLRALRGLRLVRTLTSFTRGMASLRATMRRRGFGYVSALTLLVTLLGAAAMYAFERDVPDPAGLHDYPSALWWTAMLMTTMGSAYWPVTAEGRLLCVGLALYAFAVFGYVTAMLATFFVSRDAAIGPPPGGLDQVRQELARLAALLESSGGAGPGAPAARADASSTAPREDHA